MTDLNRYGPWALIVGASEGVGSAFARRLAADGFGVVLAARNAERLEAVAGEVQALGAPSRTVALDILDEDAAERLIDATADLEIGLLVMNAGANTYGHSFVDGDLARHNEVVTLNVLRQLPLLHHYTRAMVERGRGGVITTGSVAGYTGSPREGAYAASKAFLRVFTEGLWVECKPKNVDVVHLVLGLTRTPAMERRGLNFDNPGIPVSEPDDVAAEGLAHLADGPVWITENNVRSVQRQSGPDRAAIVQASADVIAKVVGQR
ncbi:MULTISPECIES: SDR family NAD(P)-dependent oxidoreductase [Gordonia]|uniref:SDR family NAD(P)-dependent oxidoreductase n=2 Tax=Gordonia TaxID=2053 RepID=A0ABN3HFP5_9ACTN|nr:MULTISPECIES: SDR family NAD(P)-dependent oxidoreductase [Gordonia]AUH68716.1 KR domain-containing protein [Gordonia sp. YC-JH1]KJR05217.1 short-chain dehydrogenase [Gordonia sihwensis]KXT58000.1 short-chain dehydrogenase [Gordonia sp. QH-12]GAC59950.1 putative oxidoreductase [Gordonia sihwensis NBRC 108236]